MNKNNTNLKVITVDNSTIISKRMEDLLTNIQYVEFIGNAANASAAWLLIQHHVPNVVIIDIHLDYDPHKSNGIDLLIRLKEKYPEMTIIMFTNQTESQYRNKCLANGANYFFNKSEDFDKLTDTLLKIQLIKMQELNS